ncbi:MAG: sel1 repeat family protein, partial [Alphaproteobacteria bacterium]|nr:sel1 repeat family protein [Alphaproteobacteria bacterium]
MSQRREREEAALSPACRLTTLSFICTFLAALFSSFGLLSLNNLAHALDGQQYPATAKAPLPVFKNPRQAQQHGIDLYRAGEIESSLEALKYAADGGQPVAQWKLGRMYADGDGVGRDDIQAYHYFFRIVEAYDEDEITAREIPFVANAFVAVGVYSLQGIPNSTIKRDTNRAFEMFQYAAMNFGDPAAQFNLARMYLDGEGLHKDPMQAIKWLSAAVEKSHMQSQALLGKLLFNGHEGIAPQRARGLMLLTLARDAASRDKQDLW